MPPAMERCVQHVMGQGHDQSSAYAICRTSMGLKADGSQDKMPMDMPDEEMMMRVGNEMARRAFDNSPVYRKDMVVCTPFGDYVNGDQKGVMTKSRLRKLADNFKKYPRQVPVYALGDHVESLDERMPDGWVEGLSVNDSGELVASVKLHGLGAAGVIQDLIRGASIGTVQGKNPDGTAQGEVLQHLLLTNNPFDKSLNVAAARVGGEPVASYFTALPNKEADMAAEDITKLKEENESLREQLKAAKAQNTDEKVAELTALLGEKTKENLDLVASNENLKADVDKFKSPKAIEELQAKLRVQERKNKAAEIRRKVADGVDEGRFNRALVGDPKTGYKHPSDEMVLSWFDRSCFKGSMERLDIMLETMPKQRIGRTYAHGEGTEAPETGFNDEDREFLASLGKTPEQITAALKARGAGDYSRMTAKKE